jgi:predicted cupin superfamily sugar epimerase
MNGSLTAEELKKLLRLDPHPREGGWFRQTWRAQEPIPPDALPSRYVAARDAGRAAGTAIYYLLEPNTFSEMHRLASDEVFHFYLGDPVEMLQLWPDGTGRRMVLGKDLAGDELPQTTVPHGIWQGSRLIPGGQVALMGCTVSPGFEYADYESGNRAELMLGWPEWAEFIHYLTRSQ